MYINMCLLVNNHSFSVIYSYFPVTTAGVSCCDREGHKPAKPNIFTICCLTEKACQSLMYVVKPLNLFRSQFSLL